MTAVARVLVVGSSGFIGTAVCSSLEARGHEAIRLETPRVNAATLRPKSELSMAILRDHLDHCSALVNAAGVPDATGTNKAEMLAANGILPGLLAAECSQRGVRFVHVSSAAVQGRRHTLDSTPEMAPFSPYSESKARGESESLQYATTVVYRPPGVHGVDRGATRAIARLARSRFSSVAGSGSAASAQALIGNVGDAIAFLAICEEGPPPIVAHPSEGVTTGGLLVDLGDRHPLKIPSVIARSLVTVAFILARVRPSVHGHARRLEMLWFGQRQNKSWLTDAGWVARSQRDAWRVLGRILADDIHRKDQQ
ncbi:NAD(P)-dependent oxidoreductase [Dietzia sp. DQ11-44]|nr:NAD(P)-dependent oxidoreductase [Dietzia sp. Cai40]MBB1043939.1 NAD(P)-dependent oxidoreductase [Dietzia sp. DQ11-44]